MKILHRYLLSFTLRNLGLALAIFTFLFLVFDFLDRIDNIAPQGAALTTILQYFILKIPLIITLMAPVAMLVTTLFTVGLLSKNSEFTAMRASGLTIAWLARPMYVVGIIVSLLSLLLNETLVPYATRRVREIYNFDIQQKQKSGQYNQSNFWWRNQNTFYSASLFDSRTNTLYDLTRLSIDDPFKIAKRTDARETHWLTPTLGWNMSGVTEHHFLPDGRTTTTRVNRQPLPIGERPSDFYDVKTDPHTMSYRELRRFVREQSRNGISTKSLMADLYEKLSFPFLAFIIIPVVLPFALKPARSGSLATSFVAALIIGFSYYAVHSMSIALGRAELWPPLLAAWTANILLGTIGVILTLGAESPH